MQARPDGRAEPRILFECGFRCYKLTLDYLLTSFSEGMLLILPCQQQVLIMSLLPGQKAWLTPSRALPSRAKAGAFKPSRARTQLDQLVDELTR